MTLTDRQRHTLYAALRSWQEMRKGNPPSSGALKQWHDLASDGGRLKILSDDEIHELLGLLAEREPKTKEFKKLRIVEWLRSGEFGSCTTVQQMLHQAGGMLDGMGTYD